VAETESFADAALLHRTTRSVNLSETGAAYYKECAELVARLDALTDQMREIRGSPTGTLRLTVLPGFALGHLSRVLHEDQERHPDNPGSPFGGVGQSGHGRFEAMHNYTEARSVWVNVDAECRLSTGGETPTGG